MSVIISERFRSCFVPELDFGALFEFVLEMVVVSFIAMCLAAVICAFFDWIVAKLRLFFFRRWHL